MKTPRAIIASALSRWIEKGDEAAPCRVVKLVREVEGSPVTQKIETWSTPRGVSIGLLASEIEDVARENAATQRGGIVEVYGIVPYFGAEMEEGGIRTFRISTIVSDDADGESSSVGQYTEGANPRGQLHQGMRHIEGLARTYIDATSRVFGSLETMNRQLLQDNREMAAQLSSQRIELEEARDRGVERQLAVYRIYEQEKRDTKLMEGLLGAAPSLLNMALGRPILPENTTEQGVQMIKNWARSITVEQMLDLQKTLDPQQYIPLQMIKQQVEDEAVAEEKRRQEQAERETRGVMNNKEVIDTMARRDADGIPRQPLGGEAR